MKKAMRKIAEIENGEGRLRVGGAQRFPWAGVSLRAKGWGQGGTEHQPPASRLSHRGHLSVLLPTRLEGPSLRTHTTHAGTDGLQPGWGCSCSHRAGVRE